MFNIRPEKIVFWDYKPDQDGKEFGAYVLYFPGHVLYVFPKTEVLKDKIKSKMVSNSKEEELDPTEFDWIIE